MYTDLNFETEPLQHEDAFETPEEFEEGRERRARRGIRPRVLFAPGFRRRPRTAFRGRRIVPPFPTFRRPSRFRTATRIRPAFAGRPVFRRPPRGRNTFGRPVFPRPQFFGGPFFGQPQFRGGFGFRSPSGFPRSRSGFRRWPWMFGPGFTGGGFGPSAPVSELVAWAQGCLAQIGEESVPQNGMLGPATRRALAAFQQQQQLAATGVLDNQTIEALQAACSPPDEGDQGDEGGEGGE